MRHHEHAIALLRTASQLRLLSDNLMLCESDRAKLQNFAAELRLMAESLVYQGEHPEIMTGYAANPATLPRVG